MKAPTKLTEDEEYHKLVLKLANELIDANSATMRLMGLDLTEFKTISAYNSALLTILIRVTAAIMDAIDESRKAEVMTTTLNLMEEAFASHGIKRTGR